MPYVKTMCETPIVLAIPPTDHEFLQRLIRNAREGAREELARFAHEVRDPERLEREAAVYGRLLEALDGIPVVPEVEAYDVLASLARVVDEGNEYDRVVAEHGALERLLAELGRAE